MKRKSIILLSSILAGSLLVGGAFAAWAVTDNANPLGINVTPGDISHADIDYITLDWGASTALEDLGNIKPGENRKAGAVYLKSVGEKAYTGKFTVQFEDATDAATKALKGPTDPYLFDYLDVRVYSDNVDLGANGELPSSDPLFMVGRADAATAGVKSKYHSVVGTSAGAPLTIVVTLDVSASSSFSKMEKDNVRLTVDWAPAQDSDLAKDRLVYASKGNDWEGMYVYAWNNTTGENIKDYPGVPMQEYSGDVYKLAIPANMDFVIFNDGTMNDAKKTQNISLAEYTGTKQYWNGTAWSTVPAEKSYYLVGTFAGGAWDEATADYKLSVNPSNPAEYCIKDLTFAKNDTFKVCYFDGTTATAEGAPYYPAGNNTEYKVVAAGKYDIYFTPTANPEWTTGYGCGQHLWVVPTELPQSADIVIDLVGGDSGEGWATDNAVVFVHYWVKDGTLDRVHGDVKVVDGKFKVPAATEGICLVRDAAGTESIIWSGEGFYNRSDDLAFETGKVLRFKNWDKGTEGNSQFEWVTPAP